MAAAAAAPEVRDLPLVRAVVVLSRHVRTHSYWPDAPPIHASAQRAIVRGSLNHAEEADLSEKLRQGQGTYAPAGGVHGDRRHRHPV